MHHHPTKCPLSCDPAVSQLIPQTRKWQQKLEGPSGHTSHRTMAPQSNLHCRVAGEGERSRGLPQPRIPLTGRKIQAREPSLAGSSRVPDPWAGRGLGEVGTAGSLALGTQCPQPGSGKRRGWGGSEGRQREEDYPPQVQPPALSCPPTSTQLSNTPVIHERLRVPPSFTSPSLSGNLEVRLLPRTGNSNPLRRPPSPLGAKWRWQLFGQTAQ